jgi:ABC-type lipoprotein export system ATPase subunit
MPDAATEVPLMQLKEITVTFRMGTLEVPVLRGISMEVHRREFVALVGASGSGKSTLMNVLGCLSRPTSGSYLLDGVEVATISRDRRAQIRNERIGFVFQSFQLLPRTSAIEQVMMPLDYCAAPVAPREARARAEQLLERVGLKDHLRHMPNEMSGGQQQRVAIARALVNRPSILFADEPTGNLDSRTSEEIIAMFHDLNARDGLTVMIVTHAAETVVRADRTIRLNDGLVVSGAEPARAGAVA